MAAPATTAEYFIPKFEGIENLTPRESLLSFPKDNEVLVKIHAVSLNYRDIAAVTGVYPGQKPDLVPCSDMAGEVVVVGKDVKNWKKGDRVTSNFTLDHLFGDITKDQKATALGARVDGVLTQYRNFPAHSLVKIPGHLSFEEASTLPCAAVTAWNAFLGPVPLKGGDTVLIQGTGGVSIFGLQIAAAMGATIIATSSSDAKLELAKQLGATFVINYKTHPNWDEEVLKLTNGRGADHILEIGGAGTLGKSINAARMAGWIHSIGVLAGDDTTMSDTILKLIHKAIIYRSIFVGSRTQFEDMNRLIERRQIHPVIDKVFPFDQAKQAYEYLASQKHVGKVVIKVSN
ncbi:hypothetical protein QCA50_008351 [Cerrena zonata]|uniref:Enoyl reductase (ER) domain-containing protein n=1 Tax=Cerrena zonata TaxID=2478898 RepID=A0AAW0G7X7_9APHY